MQKGMLLSLYMGLVVALTSGTAVGQTSVSPASQGVLACKLAKNFYNIFNESYETVKTYERYLMLADYAYLFPEGQKIATRALINKVSGRVIEFMPANVEIIYGSDYQVEQVGEISGTNILLKEALNKKEIAIRPYNPQTDNPTLAWKTHRQRVFETIAQSLGNKMPLKSSEDLRISSLGIWLIDPLSLEKQINAEILVNAKRKAFEEAGLLVKQTQARLGSATKEYADAIAAKQRAIKIEQLAMQENNAAVATGARAEQAKSEQIAMEAQIKINTEKVSIKTEKETEAEKKREWQQEKSQFDHYIKIVQKERKKRASTLLNLDICK